MKYANEMQKKLRECENLNENGLIITLPDLAGYRKRTPKCTLPYPAFARSYMSRRIVTYTKL